MIGDGLSRFDKDREWVIFDFESNGLNLYHSLPWELAWGIGSIHSGLHTVKVRLIRWPDFKISPHLAAKTHFDPHRYACEARPPEEVWSEFSADLYSPTKRRAGHNILGFDSYMVTVWRRRMGMAADNSWFGGGYCAGPGAAAPPLIDTDCLAKAHKKGWTIPSAESSPLQFVDFQWACGGYVEKGLKTNLGQMCSEFKIDYDSKSAHSAEYDIGRNWLLLKEMAKTVDF